MIIKIINAVYFFHRYKKIRVAYATLITNKAFLVLGLRLNSNLLREHNACYIVIAFTY